MAQKLLVGNKDTVLILPAFEINGVPQMALPSTGTYLPLDGPTVALLNYFIGVTTPADIGAHWGGNITCTVVDDWTLAMKDSATDPTRTLCSVGQSEDLTFYNYEAVMNFLRDINPLDATSEFNLTANLFSAPDVPYVIAHRIGYAKDAPAALGQEWHYYYVWTDLPIPAAGDGNNLATGEAFVPKGLLNFKHVLAA